MKLVFYDDFKLGAMKGDTVVDLTDAVSGITHTSPQDLLNQLIENFSQHRSRLQPGILWREAGLVRNMVRDLQPCRCQTGDHGCPRGGTDRGRGIGIGESQSLAREVVDMGSLHQPVPLACQVHPAQVIDHHENDIRGSLGLFCGDPARYGTKKEHRQQ